MREKLSLRNIPGICIRAAAALFLAEPLTVLLLLPAFSVGRVRNLSLLPYAFVFVIAGLLFLLFQNKFIIDSGKRRAAVMAFRGLLVLFAVLLIIYFMAL